MNKDTKAILESVAGSLGWGICYGENEIGLSKFSPAGQDFSVIIEASDDIEDIADYIYEVYDEFDISAETYIWLDEDGHGKNGAPYDMKDVYEDMECCKINIKDLYDKLIAY